MIIYDLACTAGHRFEACLGSMFDPNPDCGCGESTSRVPSRLNLGGAANAGPSRDDMPTTWHGTGQGDPATLKAWHGAMTKRERLEERYPELAGDRRPILAHEGAFAGRPLRAGDDLVPTVAKAAFGKEES